MKRSAWVRCALLVFCLQGLWGQGNLDTIYASASKNVALFFPSPIRQAMVGSAQFVFSYDREEAGYFGVLQGVEGIESNLLVITADHRVYAYILKYTAEPSRLNYFVRTGDAIGHMRPVRELPVNTDSIVGQVARYGRFCRALLDGKPKVRASKRQKGVLLRLEDMVYDGREMYVVLGIRNRSGIDFEVDRLEVLRINGSAKRRASYQEIPMEPVHWHGVPKQVKDGEMVRFVYVLPKYVLGHRERLQLVLAEKRGNRRLVLNY